MCAVQNIFPAVLAGDIAFRAVLMDTFAPSTAPAVLVVDMVRGFFLFLIVRGGFFGLACLGFVFFAFALGGFGFTGLFFSLRGFGLLGFVFGFTFPLSGFRFAGFFSVFGGICLLLRRHFRGRIYLDNTVGSFTRKLSFIRRERGSGQQAQAHRRCYHKGKRAPEYAFTGFLHRYILLPLHRLLLGRKVSGNRTSVGAF